MRGYDFTYIMRYVNMSLLRLCQEFEDLSNKYVVLIDGHKGKSFVRGRGRGGVVIYTKHLTEAKVFDNKAHADGLAQSLTDFYDGMIDEHVSNDEIPVFTAIPYSEAKTIMSEHPYR